MHDEHSPSGYGSRPIRLMGHESDVEGGCRRLNAITCTTRQVDGVTGRFGRPLPLFRLFAQPLMAILFAIRDGNQDLLLREGRGACLSALSFDPAHSLL